MSSRAVTRAAHRLLLTRRHMARLLLVAALPAVARAQTPADPRAPIATLYRALETQMRRGQATPFRERYQQLAPVIDRSFDLATILRASVGLPWAKFDAKAQAALHDAFRQFIIATYVVNFDKYEGEQFAVSPNPRPSGADQVVQSHIVQKSGETVRLDYVMRQSDSGWRIVDVLFSGTISRVAVQHSDFHAVLRDGGAAALIDSLRRKSAELAGDALPDS